MRGAAAWFLLAILAVTGMAAPAHSAPISADSGFGDAATATCSPPCGYIDPLIDIQLPDKPQCRNGYRADDPGAHDGCLKLMADGGAVSFDGTLLFYWEMSNEGTYPNNPQEDIVISFGGTGNNPSWLTASVEPAEFVLGTADLFSPDNIRQEDTESGQRIWFWYERPITVTLSRDGEPSAEEVESILNRNGIRPFLLKAESTSSGDRFREGFGIEEFRFDAREEPAVFSAQDQDVPGPALPLVVAGLALGAVAFRRRN